MQRLRAYCRLERLAVALLAALLPICAAAQTRIVAVGDVHGALPEFESILKETGILDAQRGAKGGWAGGTSVLVQLGDVVDRGPQTRASLELLMELEKGSLKQKKGKVVALLGNHEIMAMIGDVRYVTPEDYRSFASNRSERARQSAYMEYQNYLIQRAGHEGVGVASVTQEKWMADHPLGFFERRDAFGPLGAYGRWLRAHDVTYRDGGVVFVHGGLSPNLNFDDLDELNNQVKGGVQVFDRSWQALAKAGVIWRYMTIEEATLEVQKERAALPMREKEDTKLKEELEKFIAALTWLSSPDNPTWYRGLANQPAAVLSPGLNALMARLKIGQIVVGHTVVAGFEIRQRFDGRVYLIDTGMLRPAFGGRASALEIQDGRFTAHTAGQPPRALSPPRTDSGTGAGSAGNSGTAQP